MIGSKLFRQVKSLAFTFLLSASVARGEALEKVQEFDSKGYMSRLSVQIRKHWAPPVVRGTGHTTVEWNLLPNGSVSELKIVKHGRSKGEDAAALTAVRAAVPFEALPVGVKRLSVDFDFDYIGAPKPLGLTVQQALKKYGMAAKERLLPEFQDAGVEYPPTHIDLLYFKDENALKLFVTNKAGKLKLLKSYTPVSASGGQGPKLKEGDLQIPEGCYGITNLDAMTHLAFWVNYPNAVDRSNATHDHRTNLGGNIQVHAGSFSTGCIVLSNEDMQELFLLGYEVGCKNIELVVTPCNLLAKKPDVDFRIQPKWLPKLYADLRNKLATFPLSQTRP